MPVLRQEAAFPYFVFRVCSPDTDRYRFPLQREGKLQSLNQFAGCPGFGRGDPWILGVGAPLVPSPPSLLGTLTILSGGGVLLMKHLIWPFSPWRACWVCVLEMMGGPVGKMTSC